MGQTKRADDTPGTAILKLPGAQRTFAKLHLGRMLARNAEGFMSPFGKLARNRGCRASFFVQQHSWVNSECPLRRNPRGHEAE